MGRAKAAKLASLVKITGVVQGVGFRPHIYRRAVTAGFSGWVANDPSGVLVYLELDTSSAATAINELLGELPQVARVDTIAVEEVPSQGLSGFAIADSRSVGPIVTEMSRDLAVCVDCLAEMRDIGNRRYGYPYITCTNCGPRYSVMTALPYDRKNTTMAPWTMCEACSSENCDPMDRRFHAEPIACWDCGPRYHLYDRDLSGRYRLADGDARDAVVAAAQLLSNGEIVAVKGVGGYHFACDAKNSEAVMTLRAAKFRKDKPFAVMARDIASVEEICWVSVEARSLLLSPSAPIVILPARSELLGVAPGFDQIGVMLPYTPLHHLLFDAAAPGLLVMTSGNRSSEPIAYLDEDALENFSAISGAVLVGERPIARRLDDSVVLARGSAPLLRRSRGLSPAFVARVDHGAPIIACGADLKSTVAVAVGSKVLVSQYLGDLEYHEVQLSHRRTVTDLLGIYDIDPASVQLCADLHPGYFSTALAEKYVEEFGTRELLRVQHHRAHIASVLAEWAIWDQSVVGVAMDGTGYGDDGSIWGGEFFWGSLKDGFERVASLSGAHLLGGEAAARRPLQALAGYLDDNASWALIAKDVFGVDAGLYRVLSSLRFGREAAISTTSAGRLFDCVAAICGFSGTMSYEGQAAMWLENLARASSNHALDPIAISSNHYRFEFAGAGTIDFQEMLTEAIQDRLSGTSVGTIAMRFHLGFALAVAAMAARIARERGSQIVVLSGGVFLNRIFSDAVSIALRDAGLDVKMNLAVSCNDEGISLGQVAIAAAKSATQTSGKRGER